METNDVDTRPTKVLVDRKALESIVNVFIGFIAGGTGGEAETKRQLLEALESSEPVPDSLVSSMIGYPGHRGDRAQADLLSMAFRGRKLNAFDAEASELIQHEARNRDRFPRMWRNPSI